MRKKNSTGVKKKIGRRNAILSDYKSVVLAEPSRKQHPIIDAHIRTYLSFKSRLIFCLFFIFCFSLHMVDARAKQIRTSALHEQLRHLMFNELETVQECILLTSFAAWH